MIQQTLDKTQGLLSASALPLGHSCKWIPTSVIIRLAFVGTFSNVSIKDLICMSFFKNLLIQAAKKEPFDDELEQILDLYSDDFDEHQLRTQMKTFSKNCQFEKRFRIRRFDSTFQKYGARCKSIVISSM